MSTRVRTTDEELAIGCLKFLAAVLAVGVAMGLAAGFIMWLVLG